MKFISWSILLLCLTASAQLKAANYYINSRTGSDSNNGTNKDQAWKSLQNLEEHKFLPGDSILFAKGSSYKGGFVFSSSGTEKAPIVFSSYSVGADIILNTDRKELSPLFEKYGAGPAPSFTNPDWSVLNGNIFRILGSYIVIDGLYFHDNTNPPGSDKKTKNVQKLGAVYFALGTHHNTLKNCEFFHTPVGVKVKGNHNLITRNYFRDANIMMAYSWGPIAIMIVKGDNEISWNKIENYGAYGGPYGSDGGVIELDGVDDDFQANNVNIHHNISINNHGFLEIAARNVENITVAYNLSDDKNQFIGGGSMKNVRVINNTVIRTREPNVDRHVFWTFYPEGSSYVVRNNIFVIPKDMKVFGPYKKPIGHVRTPIGEHPHDHNLYYSPGNPDPIGISAGKGDIIANPLFADPENRNFRLTKKSPARGKGAKLGYTVDIDNYPVESGSPDIGAFQF
ncbi:hypothetical protein [Desertivirga xinjiangensis]|uniref:hypothetical protein n=1 Tax=Desertivirga xinjiangensis TaxID=539206 RepID=UPI00210E6D40|nr:hypothetical protein [Pedobacter xinjiangensis]